MEGLSPEVLATLVAAELAEAHRPVIDDAVRDELARRIETALRRVAREERAACVAVCGARQAMWEATENRSTIAEPLRAEARARSNEAAVIADALRERGS
jgi:predicted transcriptional regulator